jgi:hypothetical protein
MAAAATFTRSDPTRSAGPAIEACLIEVLPLNIPKGHGCKANIEEDVALARKARPHKIGAI